MLENLFVITSGGGGGGSGAGGIRRWGWGCREIGRERQGDRKIDK